jgi:hypothetical protein
MEIAGSVISVVWRGSYSAYSVYDSGYRTQDNCAIEDKVSIVNVVEVVLQIFMNRKCACGTYLPQAGYPRPNGNSFTVDCMKFIHNKGHLRSWTDDAHLPHKNIDELGQFIDTEPANQPSDASETNVCSVLRRDRVLWHADPHAAKLPQQKPFASFANSKVPKEYGAWRVQFDCQSDQQEQGRKYDQERK